MADDAARHISQARRFSRSLAKGPTTSSDSPIDGWRSRRGLPAWLDATDKDVSIGGAGLVGAVIELGLVDELRMFRNPVVAGGGSPFLPPVTEEIALNLIETRTFGSRVIYERYRRAPDESD